MVSKAKVGLLGLMLELYDRSYPELKEKQAAFARQIAAALSPAADVLFPGVCNTRERVDRAVRHFEAEGADLIMPVCLTYAPSLIALPALLRTPLPIVIFNTVPASQIGPEFTFEDYIESHGMHGVQDLANVLVRAGRDFHLVTGHVRDGAAVRQLHAWCDAARTLRFARDMRVGLLGYPFPGMGDFGIDHTAFLTQVGATVVQLDLDALVDAAERAPESDVRAHVADDLQRFARQEGYDEDLHLLSARMECGLRALVREERLDAIAMHFGALAENPRVATIPFLGASKLMAEGIGYGGEGDVTSAAAVALMAHMVGAATFTEPFCIDFGNDQILMSHMGEGNPDFARTDARPRLVFKPFRFGHVQAPASLAFSVEPGDVTLVNLTTAAGQRLRLTAAEARVVDFPPTPHFKIATRDCNVPELLNRYSRLRGSHHFAMTRGHVADTVDKFAALAGIPFECIA